ncbi:MAG: BON domain-containing protein [Planctomyces sp.]|nr:BON domain-containing protein [Planctomyces sp.]
MLLFASSCASQPEREPRCGSPSQDQPDAASPAPGQAPPPADGSVEAAIREAFDAAGRGALRRIQVRIDAATIRLVGLVPNFHCKQMAQHICLELAGERLVDNQLQVQQRIPIRRPERRITRDRPRRPDRGSAE